LQGESRCDVAVVGGGFTGLSAALALAGRGLRVAVMEAGHIGSRASGRNGGQIVPGLKPRADRIIARFGAERGKRMLDFAHGAADRAFDLIRQHRIECDVSRNGWIQSAFSRRSRDDLLERAQINAQHGADVEFVDASRIVSMVGSKLQFGGLVERRAGSVHPLKLARGLALAVQESGARLHESTRALAIEPQGGAQRWRIRAETGHVMADQVILATDGYTDRLWPSLSQSLVNVASVQLATAALPDALQSTILPARAGVSETRKITFYYRIGPQGRFMIGGRGAMDDGVDQSTVARIRRAAVERFPALQGIEWEYAWSGRVAMTLDDTPHVHVLAPGVWTAAGYCGRGVALAIALGEQLAALAAGSRPDDVDFPVTPLKRIPFFPLRQPAAAAAMTYYSLKDRLGFPS
jgi:glycine/D-amino acid oxidase-like deaminating enzyme